MNNPKMKILIANDDGVTAPGLGALVEELNKIADVLVVAPESECSGYAAAITICQPLTKRRFTMAGNYDAIAVRGTPADCVFLALNEIYADESFDLVVTGINSGANLGQDVLFSGTFGAAATARIFGLPAIATSLVGAAVKGYESVDSYRQAAAYVRQLIEDTVILEVAKKLPHHVLNVNIPDIKHIQGYRLTELLLLPLKEPVSSMIDPRNQTNYWLSMKKVESDASQLNKGCTQQAVIGKTGEINDDALVENHKNSISSKAEHNIMNSSHAKTTDSETKKVDAINESTEEQVNPISLCYDVACVKAGYVSISPVRLPSVDSLHDGILRKLNQQLLSMV